MLGMQNSMASLQNIFLCGHLPYNIAIGPLGFIQEKSKFTATQISVHEIYSCYIQSH